MIVLIFYSATLLKMFLSCRSLLVEFLGSFIYIIISFDFFLSYFCPLISFSFLIALSKVSSTVLSGYGESGQPCLVPDLNGIAFVFYATCNLALLIVF